MGSISTDDVKLSNTFILQSFQHFLGVEATSRRSKDGTTQILNAMHLVYIELDPIVRKVFVEPSVTPFDAPDLSAAILKSK